MPIHLKLALHDTLHDDRVMPMMETPFLFPKHVHDRKARGSSVSSGADFATPPASACSSASFLSSSPFDSPRRGFGDSSDHYVAESRFAVIVGGTLADFSRGASNDTLRSSVSASKYDASAEDVMGGLKPRTVRRKLHDVKCGLFEPSPSPLVFPAEDRYKQAVACHEEGLSEPLELDASLGQQGAPPRHRLSTSSAFSSRSRVVYRSHNDEASGLFEPQFMFKPHPKRV